MKDSQSPLDFRLRLLNQAPLILFVVLFAAFGALTAGGGDGGFWQSSKFLTRENMVNILIQTASTGIVAVGMTFVLLTAGVDLSVGAIMFVCAAVGGKMILADWSFPLTLLTMAAAGAVYGAVNGFFVARFKIMAFIVTLATLYFGRGLGLWITQTRAMNLPESFYELGAGTWLGVPTPAAIFLLILIAAHVVLSYTPFGRQIYAVGQDAEAARKAGVATGRLVWSVYVICGVCAAVGGIVALSQSPAVSPTFGYQREFAAIAAAVIGGTSLFGGRGKVVPGTLMGAVLIQTIENGLVIMNANPYSYPLVASAIIFLAVSLDCYRTRVLNRVNRRKIRLD